MHTDSVMEHKAIVSLTFDGGFPSHSKEIAPMLDQRGVAGTFYVCPMNVLDCVEQWSDLAQRHEIGAHPFFDFADEHGLLPATDPALIRGELSDFSDLIQEVKFDVQSFAYPLGTQAELTPLEAIVNATARQMVEEAIQGEVKHRFGTIRSARIGVNQRNGFDPKCLRCYRADSLSSETMIGLVELAVEHGSWLILAFSDELGVIDVVALTKLLKHIELSRADVSCVSVGQAAQLYASNQVSI